MPMAAYERALLLITQHTDRVSQDPNRSGDYELLLEVPKKCWIKCHTRQMLNLSNNSKIHYIAHQQCQYSEWIITTYPSIPMWKGERFVHNLLTIVKFNFRQERNLPQQKGSSRITTSCGDSWDVYMLHVEPYSVSWVKRSVALVTYSRFFHFLLDLFFCICAGPNFQSTHMLRLSYIQYFEIVQHECTFDVLFLVDSHSLMSCKVILNTHSK
jgi:hypothetical protein